MRRAAAITVLVTLLGGAGAVWAVPPDLAPPPGGAAADRVEAPRASASAVTGAAAGSFSLPDEERMGPPAPPSWERPEQDEVVPGREYTTVLADEAAGSAQHALWAFTVGFLVHGTGHYLAGDDSTALRLLLTEVAGILLVSGALIAEQRTGNAPEVAPYTRPIQALGAAAFASSWLIDLIGTVSGRAGTPRYDAWPADPVVASVHYTLWSDTRQGHLNLFTLGARLPGVRLASLLRRVELSLTGTWDPFDLAGRPLMTGGTLGLRILGSSGEQDSRLQLDLEWVEEWRDDQGFGVSTPLASLQGRIHLGGLVPRLRNVLLVGRWGYGLEAIHFAGQSDSWSLDGQRSWVPVGEMGLVLPLMRTGRMVLGWRFLNDRLLSAGSPGRAPYHLGFGFHLSTSMALSISLNMGTGFDGWLGLEYRYY